MIRRSRAQIPIIEDQAREAIRRIEMNIKYLEEQLEVARECQIEAVRSENKDLAYELSLLGDDAIADVDAAEDQDALQKSLKERLERLRNGQGEGGDMADDLDNFFT